MEAVAKELAIVGQETNQEVERRTKPASSNISPNEKELWIIFSELLKPKPVPVRKRHILQWAENVDFIF